MAEHREPTSEQLQSLIELGLSPVQIPVFMRGEIVVYLLPTESSPGIAMVELAETRLRSGIVEINDPGGALKTLGRFRERSSRVAKLFGFGHLELFGAAVVNPRILKILQDHGFTTATAACPGDLGGGMMDILYRVFDVE
ncbi:MAG TPA: hypothetical protein VND64_22845 [Pirellulales bacterium]|nr:hypothetical protein [Pirellulales bacterium]